ncbi:LytTR family transcriptional regulator [Marivita sp. S6314]|uniref:LytTR family DNA-binding domain-containing protein n=1 Tax=Marivita sp. S6314 TaxID=2926406 RepID=UPI001FF0DF97|nr:LytTR family transcriptional regulator [Marivita sp. S6314]
MTNGPLQLTLREWRQHLLHPLTLTAQAGVTAVLALVGPFGTLLSLSLPERAAYWGLLVVAGYVVGYAISYALLRNSTDSFARIMRVCIAGVLTGIAMSTLVILLNAVVFGLRPTLPDLPISVGTTVAISMIVMAVIDLFNRHLSVAPTPPPARDEVPPLLDRLPFDKRGALVALSVEDHYVRVRTTNGEDMLLMRLADAIREVGTTPGTQVHRSHWAAFDQIAKVTKHNDRATLTMKTGLDVPVSRSNLPKLKEAGLLP